MECLKNIGIYVFYIIAIFICACLALSIGRYNIPLSEIFACIFGFGDEQMQAQKNIIFELRLPRIILAIFLGAGLSLAGAAFQSLFKNPLASPDILGVTSGASFGAVLALMLGLGFVGVEIFGLIFGVASLVLVVLVSYDRNAPYNTITIILSGIIIAALFQSLVSLIKYIADPQDTLPTITYWLLGSLDCALTFQSIIALGLISVSSIVILLCAWKINLLTLEDDEAKTLGINLLGFRILIILVSSIIIACSVSLCGIIGWVGLLVPHIARLIVGSENSKLMPLCAVIGAIFLMCVDTLSRTISSNQIPISILTAIIGAPFFIYILHKSKGTRL